MKKGTSFILFFIAILGITFSSCKLKIEEENLYDKPAVHVTENQVTVVISKVNVDTKYINIYRRDKQNDEVYNIGILFHPEALVNDNKNYIYVDTLVKENHSYDYRVRYRINDEYFYSEWSDIIEIKTGYKAYDEDKNLTYQKEENTQFLYEKQDKTLEIQGTIHDPDFDEFTTENYKPMLIIQSNTKTQAFELPASFIAGTSQLELRGVLPNDFLDTDISIKGIVAQKTIFADEDTTKPDEERTKKIIIWTEPLELDILGAGSSKTINIPSESGSSGLDYSRSAK